ncbi:MAG: hypothetical protein FWE76_04800 [Symbiobacteriaceae bacterium]|nr:hypothetical protein [Symbiobacteriaceae bacterium]
MSKGGIGVGTASIVLVFAVLCLTIFSLISLSAATGDMALVDAEVNLVCAYYNADTLAEMVLDSLLQVTPFFAESYHEIAIQVFWYNGGSYAIVEYVCPISERKELSVNVKIGEGYYDILCWKMQDAVVWVFDPSIPIWQGEPFWLP